MNFHIGPIYIVSSIRRSFARKFHIVHQQIASKLIITKNYLRRWLKILYGWEGYGFWGLLVTALGSVGTLIASMLAAKRAGRAQIAAENAQQIMAALDILSELGKTNQKFIEIRLRIEASDWRAVSECCGQIRDIVAAIIDSKHVEFSDDHRSALTSLIAQMTTMAKSADKAHHLGDDFEPIKAKSVLGKQSETLTKLVARFKEDIQ